MPNTDNLCMSCMKPIGDAKQCPYCGYHADSPQLSPYLPIRSVVANRYLVGKVLEFNGDGVTYAGWDMTERRQGQGISARRHLLARKRRDSSSGHAGLRARLHRLLPELS